MRYYFNIKKSWKIFFILFLNKNFIEIILLLQGISDLNIKNPLTILYIFSKLPSLFWIFSSIINKSFDLIISLIILLEK